MDHRTCPLCGEAANLTPLQQPAKRIECDRCGTFEATILVILGVLPALDRDRRAQISSWTRRRTDRGEDLPRIVESEHQRSAEVGLFFNVDEILAAPYPRTVPERLSHILLTISEGTEPGEFRRVTKEDRFRYFAKSAKELNYYLSALDEIRLVDVDQADGLGVSFPYLEGRGGMVTPAGWQEVSRMQGVGADTKQAFVAMSFDPSLLPAWLEGLKRGVEGAHFVACRVDREEHNDKVDDRIVAEIRRSRFLVADVTRHRQGVYFEAGYAMGLGLPVIWTCREDELSACHFDTRQYNHVVWENPAELAQKLETRIRATI